METDQTVRCLLMATPGEPLCAACLAFACETSLTEMRKGTNGFWLTSFCKSPEVMCLKLRCGHGQAKA